MKHYKIGVIGLGARGETFARSLFQGTPRAELCGLCDIDEDRLQKFVRHCGLESARQFTDVDAFLAQPELDGVIITTPDFSHRDVALKTIAAGKHFYLEKPMDVTVQNCKDIIAAAKTSNVRSFMGFNLRLGRGYRAMKEIIAAGTIGQIVQIEGLEHVGISHGASFMRRFHRRRKLSGGLLNTKSSHDMDIMQWLIGHEHKLSRVSAFGGCNVLLPAKAPAKYCHECALTETCPYVARPGYAFPVGGDTPLYHRDAAQYGGDLCVYNDEKDICDNMTTIFEWDSGIRGNFNLQLFNPPGGVGRMTKVFGEKGVLELRDSRVTLHESTSTSPVDVPTDGYEVIHGKGDPQMIALFIDAIEGKGDPTMRLEAGLAASILSLKAEEAMLTGEVIKIDPTLYDS